MDRTYGFINAKYKFNKDLTTLKRSKLKQAEQSSKKMIGKKAHKRARKGSHNKICDGGTSFKNQHF